MLEIELKFQIAEGRRNALLKALDPKKSEQIHLQAKYYDTPQQHLAQLGAALRQRLEGTRWVQTFKAAQKSHFHRFEHNYDLGECSTPPALDLAIYQNSAEAQQLLNQALSESKQILTLYFETDIQRTSRILAFNQSQIEVCLDIGEIRSEHRKHLIYEVEFELKSGNEQDLLAFCFEWVKKYQLWLDVRSKAEMGNLLAQNISVSPARYSKNFVFSKKETADFNLRHLTTHQLQHLLPNIAAISAQLAQDEHLQQAHHALQDLYFTVSLFKAWSPDISEKWSNQLAAFKQQFEHLQHLQHMQRSLVGLLQNKNTAQTLAQDILYAREKLTYLVRSTQNVHHFLELLMFSFAPATTHASLDLKNHAQLTLQHQYKQLQDTLQQADIHQFDKIQKLAQQLHALQFSFPLLTQIYDVKNLQKYSKALSEATHAADEYWILHAASEYLQHSELEPSDWFVLGWLAAKQEMHAEKLIEASQQFLVSRKFLKV